MTGKNNFLNLQNHKHVTMSKRNVKSLRSKHFLLFQGNQNQDLKHLYVLRFHESSANSFTQKLPETPEINECDFLKI
jgi:hypothetical protein